MTDVAHVQDGQAGNDNLETELSTLPEKFRGKNITDVVAAYTALEQEKSRLANELGESRRMVSTLLEVKPKEPVEPKPRPEITSDELLTNPTKTLDEVIESHPTVRKAKETVEELGRQQALDTFEREFPTYKNDLNDTQFVDWVKKNPVRQNLIVAANQYDLNSARALWQMWGEHQELVQARTTTATQEAARKAAERDGTLEGSTGADTSPEVTLNRAEMRELHRKALLGDKSAQAKWNDPAFKRMRIMAYADQRVE